MRRNYMIFAFIFAILISITGCIEPAYIQQTDTPPELEGFLGFRWDTPMSILNDHLMQTCDVIPCEHYYDFYSLAYENFYFLDKKAYLCKFIFGYGSGLKGTDIIFLPDPQNTYSDLDYLLERLSEIYGSPEEAVRPAVICENQAFIEGYFWFGGRLSLRLMPTGEIIIGAGQYYFSFSPPIYSQSYRNKTREGETREWETRESQRGVLKPVFRAEAGH